MLYRRRRHHHVKDARAVSVADERRRAAEQASKPSRNAAAVPVSRRFMAHDVGACRCVLKAAGRQQAPGVQKKKYLPLRANYSAMRHVAQLSSPRKSASYPEGSLIKSLSLNADQWPGVTREREKRSAARRRVCRR